MGLEKDGLLLGNGGHLKPVSAGRQCCWCAGSCLHSGPHETCTDHTLLFDGMGTQYSAKSANAILDEIERAISALRAKVGP